MVQPVGPHKLQLAAAFGVGAALVLVAQCVIRSSCKSVGRSCRNASPPTKAQLSVGSEAAERELNAEQLSRIHAFFGEKGFKDIADAFVVVVGLGGVGSHAAHMLARSGVGKLRLIDFDNVTLSSLNRHAVATRADVGTAKVAAMKKHLREIVPQCEVEDVALMFEANSADELLSGRTPGALAWMEECG